MFGFQAEGASPIVQNKVIKNPETIATAIQLVILLVGIRRLMLLKNQMD